MIGGAMSGVRKGWWAGWLAAVLLGWVGSAYGVILSSERQVLINIYNNTGGSGWANRTGWRNASDSDFAAPGTECTWYGVTCSAGDAHVTRVLLSNNNLVGSLPSLRALTSLGVFYGQLNHLTGSIPSLSGMASLMEFDVTGNQLTGSVPSLSGLTSLTSFSVARNQLSGSLPSLSELTALQYLFVEENALTGSIPSLSNLTSLRWFYVFDNQLSGEIPPLTGLTALQRFAASRNNLTGSIPSLAGLTSLTDFNVSFNQLTGTIPPLNGLGALSSLYVSGNQLTGVVPPVPSPTNALGAGYSRLCPNQLTHGADPAWDAATGQTPWYTDCLLGQTITNFAVTPSGAMMGGSGTLGATGGGSAMPVVFGSATPAICQTSGNNGNAVKYVAAGACVLTADQAGDGTNYLAAPQVRLTVVVQGASLPPSERQALISLYDSTAGSGWSHRDNWRNASDTDFADVGSECAWYGVTCDAALAHVVQLNLASNHLVGTLPALGGLSGLSIFDVGDNQLTGNIPPLAGLGSLAFVNVAGNQLTGSIPALTGLTALQYFYAARNQLTGSLPSFADLVELRFFTVNNNQVTGNIPSLAGLVKLRVLRVDHNQLVGTVPAVPSPTSSLSAGLSILCPNNLRHTANPAWDTATASTPWYRDCPATVPDAPTLLRLISGRHQIRIVFQAPEVDGGASIISYTAQCTANGTTKSVSGTSSPLTVTGLTDGVRYTCSVHAANEVGAGAESVTLTRVAGAPVSLAPLLLLLGD